MTTKVQLNNKIHTATTPGAQGSCRDQRDHWAITTCGTRNAKTRPSYVADDRAVTCLKCLP